MCTETYPRSTVFISHIMDFCRISIAFSVCICLQCASTNANMEKKRVVIVGAGASGIAAATRLYENGIKDILVLEANEARIGGRVHTVDVKNGTIEMGAQWIHGEKGNPVYHLASTRNLTCARNDSASVPELVRSTGESIRSDLASRLLEIEDRVLNENSGENATSFKNCGEFLINFFETEFKEMENVSMPDDVKSEFLEFCHRDKRTEDGCETWFDLSISTFDEYEVCEGDQAVRWCQAGYRKLFSILMENSQKMSNGTFQSDVVALNTTVERITLNHDEQNSSVIVECSNGRKIHADHVIVTVSLGVLKESHTKLFENGTIPKLKIDSIEHLEFGTVDKIYIEFPERWWSDNITDFQLLWTENDRSEFHKRGLGWVVGMYVITTVDFVENFLCIWINSAEARTMESLDEKVVRDTVVEVLKKILGKRWTIPEPIRIIRSNWYSNKYFRGSYSYRSPRTDAANVSSYTLSIPVNNSQNTPIILFAGEATSEHHYSTVHGAVESGWREADRLIKYFTS